MKKPPSPKQTERKAQYISNLMKQKEMREIEQTAALDRMERLKVEKEMKEKGGAPVERFITSAYKEQLKM